MKPRSSWSGRPSRLPSRRKGFNRAGRPFARLAFGDPLIYARRLLRVCSANPRTRTPDQRQGFLASALEKSDAGQGSDGRRQGEEQHRKLSEAPVETPRRAHPGRHGDMKIQPQSSLGDERGAPPDEERAATNWVAARPREELKATIQGFHAPSRAVLRSLQDLREKKVDPRRT